MMTLQFEAIQNNVSDIKDHLSYLRSVAKGKILELGTRTGNSTVAFLAGLEDKGGYLWSVDIDPACEKVAQHHPQWSFILSDSLNEAVIAKQVHPPFDVLFLDTLHSYKQVWAELCLWGPKVKTGGLILVHDVLSFPPADMACNNFARVNYFDYDVREGSNGLGIIKKTGGSNV